MAYIDEIQKLPLFKTIFIILFIVFSLFPPLLFFYALEPNLFLKMDFFKILILVPGFGLTLMSSNIFFIMLTFIIISDDQTFKNPRHNILSLSFFYTLISYFVLYILMNVPDNFLLKVTELKYAILTLIASSIIIAMIMLVALGSVMKKSKKESKA